MSSADRPAPLWLALHFPRLALAALGQAEACAAIREQGLVWQSSAEAERLGVLPGLRVGSALGMAPQLLLHERQLACEQALLHQLACWGGQFTPSLSLAGPDEVLLEIGGCLRLFGGLEALLARLQTQAEADRLPAFQSGLAPTPLAAQWLARAGAPGCTRLAALHEALAHLPLAVLRLSARELRLCESWGVRSLGELLRLPVAGLQRRLGDEIPQWLGMALGDWPDLRPGFSFPERFEQSLALPAPLDHTEGLLFAARRLIGALLGWLRQRLLGVRECRLWLTRERAQAEFISLSFAEPVHDSARFERVLRERLGRHPLQAPANGLRLEVLRAEALAAHSGELFAAAAPRESVGALIERLRARLGEAAVHALQVCADHRPERASQAAVQGQGGALPAHSRPFWLLARPQRLREQQGRPWLDGPLRLESQAERIESGWWDDEDVRRDYFVASTPDGARLWIYRDAGGWHLHGRFG